MRGALPPRASARNRPSIAVVSPFVDKRHGTERCVAEQIERLARIYGYEVHLYSQRVEDVEVVRSASGDHSGRIVWHRVSKIPGPHLVNYLWWFAANHVCRWWNQLLRGIRCDLLYSPGINCLDADLVSVHIVFGEFYERVRGDLGLRHNPVRTWPRLVHRRVYYRLIMALERAVYRRDGFPLVAVSRKTSEDLVRLHARNGEVQVVYHGLDLARFNPELCYRLRPKARQALDLREEAFALLLVGNDWKKKGLPALLDALGILQNPNLSLLVVGRDDRALVADAIAKHAIARQVLFLPMRPDVEFYYAAADAYVGPSLEDAFALPPAEAMACGLPVIVSRAAGVSEIVTDGVDGLVLENPRDAGKLAALIQRLLESAELRHRLGEHAATTARTYTWDRNAEQLHRVIQQTLAQMTAHGGAQPRGTAA
jgi:glycosyltransferase involved in cell wall biosynthesis